MGVHHSSLQRLVCRRLGIPGIVGGTKMTNSCTCKAEHWQNHVESCPAYKPRPLLTVENIRSGAIPADAFVAGFLLGEIERLRKREGQLMEFLRSFISGGVNQDFKPWARELYQKLYGTHEPLEQPLEAEIRAATSRKVPSTEDAGRPPPSNLASRDAKSPCPVCLGEGHVSIGRKAYAVDSSTTPIQMLHVYQPCPMCDPVVTSKRT